MKKTYLLVGLVCSLATVIVVCLPLAGRMQAHDYHTLPTNTPTVIIQKLFGGTPIGVSAKSTVSLPACLSNPTATPYAPRCYSPQQIRKAYDVNGLLNAGITGKGQTIVIIGETLSPTLQDDLHLYDQLFGLQDPPRLNVIAPFGIPPLNGAYGEVSLDVQSAHALAPDATIDLVLTGNTSKEPTQEHFFYDLLKPVKYAVDHNLGSSISISYGGGESCFDTAFLQYEHAIFQKAREKGMSVFISSGDDGAATSPSCTSPTMTMNTNPLRLRGVNILAADPLVTSVGGTTLNAKLGSGTYSGETAWNDTYNHIVGTGGGFSSDFRRPNYQQGVPSIGAMRGLPDVSWDGNTLTGVPQLEGHSGSTPAISSGGGTSLGAPSWAGLSALFDQYAGKRLGFLNEALYRILKSQSYHQGFRDITIGNNNVIGSDANHHAFPVTGYNAGPGWDATTGIGTPKVSALAPLLKQYVYPGDGQGL